MPPLKILFVASEVAPFRKTGGLADVAGSLPKALRRRGMDVRIVMPLYSGIRWTDLELLDGPVQIPMYGGTVRAGVRLGHLPGSDVPIYFVEYNKFFDRPYLYGPPGQAYPDNLERFALLSRGSLELCKALGFIPRRGPRQRLADRSGARIYQHRRMGAPAARGGHGVHDP
jgi:starch synthase